MKQTGSRHRPEVGPLLKADARNRAIRALFWAFIAAIFIDVWPFINDALQGTDPINMNELVRATARMAIQSAGAFAMRRYFDPSPFPTPLPPDPDPVAQKRTKRK